MLTSEVPARSSLSPGHWVMACRLPVLSRALSSVCRTSKSFWCSEQAARCSASSCLRDSAKGRVVAGQGRAEAKVWGGLGWRAAVGVGSSSPNLPISREHGNNNTIYRVLNMLSPYKVFSVKPYNHAIQYYPSHFMTKE